MDAEQLPLIMDVDAVPSSGLSFYFPAAADGETAVSSTTTLITDADVISSGFSCFSPAVAAEAASALAVDAEIAAAN